MTIAGSMAAPRRAARAKPQKPAVPVQARGVRESLPLEPVNTEKWLADVLARKMASQGPSA